MKLSEGIALLQAKLEEHGDVRLTSGSELGPVDVSGVDSHVLEAWQAEEGGLGGPLENATEGEVIVEIS